MHSYVYRCIAKIETLKLCVKTTKLLFTGNVEEFIFCKCFKDYRIIFKGNITSFRYENIV